MMKLVVVMLMMIDYDIYGGAKVDYYDVVIIIIHV